MNTLIRILSLLVALLGYSIPALAEYFPGSTVDFGQQGVGTSSPEIEVVKIRHFSSSRNTVAVNVFGLGFSRGPSSTCPTSPGIINADCVVTVRFAPTAVGLKMGTVVARIGLCAPPCADQTWNLKGTGISSPPPAPAAPTLLSAEPASSSQITLAWDDKSNNENGFYIERSTSLSGPFTRIFTTTANVTGYSDSSLEQLTTYFYRVQAFGSGGTSGYSNIVFTKTPPSEEISDTVPPQLVMFNFTPATIDVTSGAKAVMVTARVTDNLSGTVSVSTQFQSPSGRQFIPVNGVFLTRTSGTALDGIYEGASMMPPAIEAGVWKVNFVQLRDDVGNFVDLSAANLQSLGFPTALSVASVQDIQAPTISNIAFPTPSINVSSGAQPLSLDLTVADDLSGVDFDSSTFVEFRVTLASPSGGQSQFISRPEFVMMSGTTVNGTWRGTTSIPQYSEAGTWTIASIRLIDFAGNQRFYNVSQLQELGVATQFSVISAPSDTIRPTVTGVTFSPSVIDTSSGDQTVTVALTTTDDLSGVSFAVDNVNASFRHGVQFLSPSGGQRNFAVNADFKRTAGTVLNGVWTATVLFPQFSEGGTWKLSLLDIKDTANNGVFNGDYSTAMLGAMGFPTDLTIFRPSGDIDATVPPGGGTATDPFFGERASVTFPPGALPSSTGVAIDVLSGSNPLGLPAPAGFSGGTLFVNVALTPTPPMPFPAPGLTVVLPISIFKTPGSPISLFRLDPVLGNLVPAVSVTGQIVVGTVNADGLSATFTGVSHLSTLVGFVPQSMLGDVNGDGVVSCADLTIVKIAFAKRTGQAGYDIRADLNRNGVIDVSDLALVSRQLPPGTACL